MLYIAEEAHSSRGAGIYLFAVEAESKKEAEILAKEYIKHDKRVLFPKFVKMIAHESLCPVVINKDNIKKVCKEAF